MRLLIDAEEFDFFYAFLPHVQRSSPLPDLAWSAWRGLHPPDLTSWHIFHSFSANIRRNTWTASLTHKLWHVIHWIIDKMKTVFILLCVHFLAFSAADDVASTKDHLTVKQKSEDLSKITSKSLKIIFQKYYFCTSHREFIRGKGNSFKTRKMLTQRQVCKCHEWKIISRLMLLSLKRHEMDIWWSPCKSIASKQNEDRVSSSFPKDNYDIWHLDTFFSHM